MFKLHGDVETGYKSCTAAAVTGSTSVISIVTKGKVYKSGEATMKTSTKTKHPKKTRNKALEEASESKMVDTLINSKMATFVTQQVKSDNEEDFNER